VELAEGATIRNLQSYFHSSKNKYLKTDGTSENVKKVQQTNGAIIIYNDNMVMSFVMNKMI
jgi:hypothetical protein